MNKFDSIVKSKKYHYVYINELANYNNNYENYSNFKIDNELKYSTLIKNLFYKNTFNNNKMVICNILTHFILWKKLLKNNLYDYLIILDYNIDITNVDKVIYNLIDNNDFDILILKNTFDKNIINNENTDMNRNVSVDSSIFSGERSSK